MLLASLKNKFLTGVCMNRVSRYGPWQRYSLAVHRVTVCFSHYISISNEMPELRPFSKNTLHP